ncbi:metal ABC transporter ATP-binding protein [Corynebacterium ulcerans]|uniref:Manganese ABC transporter ATP-binding protein n=1 Tax=Corynebacterium ulcerans TaxID=65058 RepID=A0ABD0BJD4_CORUL|nr:metal ABC transporter ATP-binding protein [Corynebacterium ulcerans]KPH78579.1 manganese ABC transporter ATP-binding protein [Corynebacterium ulcerans]MBL4944396.1 metal ABC transporter ATP-binding protein [Corynebacterium ulcerans]OIS06344.1 manganese ABC transporter ATP-binding protein [Corynebacterium ulcerans]PME07080.1 manganese ABC transporter ATP-binding protein [Corynebacterium ulcerans]QGZ24576.1 ATP-binding cassette domain-containing protein [Corynebacterium ulcerans]
MTNLVGPALTMTGISVSYGPTVALENASIEVPAGAVMGFIGPNGAGKSTLIKSAIDLVDHDGEVSFFGQPLSHVRDRVAYMPQSADVDWDYPITVEQVVGMGLYSRVGWFKRLTGAHREEVRHALERVGIADLAKRHISELSGGQRRRVFVARILVQNPDIFLLDEPFAGVDAASERVIREVLHGLCEAGKSVVIVHHDLSTVAELCDHVTVINRRIVATGTVEEAFTRETVNAAFGLGLL